MVHLKEKVDSVLFSDTALVVSLWYSVIMILFTMGIAVYVFVLENEFPILIQTIFMALLLPYLIFQLYFLIAPVIGDHE